MLNAWLSTTGKVNSTRLKEILLAVLPELRLYPHGQEILLAYEKDIGFVINLVFEEDHDSDAMVLAKAAKLVHRKIFDYQGKFNESFNNECLVTAVHNVIMTSIRMILKGTNIADQPTSRSGRSPCHITVDSF